MRRRCFSGILKGSRAVLGSGAGTAPQAPDPGGEEKRMEESRVLCGANAYREKYYFDPAYARLPQRVQEELKILCVTFAEEISGTILLRFSADGSLQVETAKDEGDYYYDEIDAELAERAAV